MANTFKRYTARAIGTSLTNVNTVVAADTQTTVIGLSVANITTSPITITATHYDGTNDTHLVKDATVVAGGTLIIIGGDQKLVLETGDTARVSSSATSSVDCVLSVLEIT